MSDNLSERGTHSEYSILLPTYFNILFSFSSENCFQPLQDWSVAHLSLVGALLAPVPDDGLDRRVYLIKSKN